MRPRWGRVGAGLGLLVAIFSDLRRRAWWAYRAGGLHAHGPDAMIVAPRPAAPRAYVPEVTGIWRPVIARALPVEAIGMALRELDDPMPIVWIDASARPDLIDLPRVLHAEAHAHDGRPLVATQWLADHAARQALLVVTVAEPVTCTFVLSFEVPRWLPALDGMADAGELFVAWDVSPLAANRQGGPAGPVLRTLPDQGVLVPLNRPAQLRATLRAWATQFPAE